MPAGLSRALPFLMACVSTVPQIGCGAAPPAAAESPVPMAEPREHPTVGLGEPLQLDPLFAERPRPPERARNPFRLGSPPGAPGRRAPADPTPIGPTAAPADEASVRSPDRTAPPASAGAAEGVRDVRLRLIGIVEARTTAGPVAVLTDERGVYHGRAGDGVEGRYRIVSIEEASIEVEDLTRGVRMTLELSGF